MDHEELYFKFLSDLGYSFRSNSRRGKDSLVIAWRQSKLGYVSDFGIQHDELQQLFAEGSEFKRGNCALFVTLKYIETGREIQVATTHLHWNKQRDFVKYAQIINTCNHISSDKPVILCGDFNSSPDSNVPRYLTVRNFTLAKFPIKQKAKLVYYDEIE